MDEEKERLKQRVKELEDKIHTKNQKIGDLQQRIKGLVSCQNRLADNVPFWEPYAKE